MRHLAGAALLALATLARADEGLDFYDLKCSACVSMVAEVRNGGADGARPSGRRGC